MSAQDSDGWIEWKGGECPVAPETVVSIKFRDGTVYAYRVIASKPIDFELPDEAVEVLKQIAEQDDIELALDPQWPKRLSRALLDKLAGQS